MNEERLRENSTIENSFRAHQVSKRGGSLIVTLEDDRVKLEGDAVLVMQGGIMFDF